MHTILTLSSFLLLAGIQIAVCGPKTVEIKCFVPGACLESKIIGLESIKGKMKSSLLNCYQA